MSRWDVAGTDNRLLEQYRGSPLLIAMIKALVDHPIEKIRLALESLYGRLAIDTSEGVQLDRIGDIVGARRPVALVQTVYYTDEDGSLIEDEGQAGTYWASDAVTPDGGFPFVPMSDEDYRLFLRAIIFQNVSGASVPELERYSQLLLGVPASVLDGFTTVDLQFPIPLNAAQQAIIMQTFKAAAGIRGRYFTMAGGPNGFGFDGGPNTGFDDTNGAGFVRMFGEE
jgi:hypothetical protein